MKSKILGLMAVLLLGGSVAAYATEFDFSYTFQSTGDVVTGSFDGTASGNLITNLSDISVFLDGTPFNGNPTLFGNSAASSGDYVSGGAVASFDGTQNNFLFIDCDYTTASPCSNTNFFLDFTGPQTTINGAPFTARGASNGKVAVSDNTNGYVGTWQVAAAVPEPATLALFGLGLAGLGFMRRKKH